ncbi:hypothetical protein AAFX19_22315 [Vibrio harveyi]|uniref:hypothetical protein n=1 Tax=Vibrio harveyi TaxID=669 RepID=UPI0038CD2F4A
MKNILVLFFSFLIFAVATTIYFYAANVENGLSSIPENWGHFGSYIGGTISSIGTTITLWFMALGLYLQVKDKQVDNINNLRDKYCSYIDSYINEIKLSYELRNYMGKIDSAIDIADVVNQEDVQDIEYEQLVLKIESDQNLVDLKRQYNNIISECSRVKMTLYINSANSKRELNEKFVNGMRKVNRMRGEYKI